MLKLGVIGFGNRISSIVKLLLETGEVTLTAVADIHIEDAAERVAALADKNSVHYYHDAEEMLNKEKLDGVCIGTRCSLHTKYAMLAAQYNLPMFLEKPVCINYEDLSRLKTIRHMSPKTVVSFPLRMARIVTYVKEVLESGKIGELSQVQAYNNVHYARGYYHKWYRDENETGGLFLQKATHDLDYINYLLDGLQPVRICGMKSKQIFKGNKKAGLKCADCPDAKTCTESPENVRKNHDGFVIGEYCCFAEDTGNEDSGSALIEYENGLHVTYTQNFVARNGAGKRGARLIGYLGTVEFDFRTGVVHVFHHMEQISETINFDLSGGHFGGDEKLAENFLEVMKGTADSCSTLDEGILSAEMCLAAKKSSLEHVFVDIEG